MPNSFESSDSVRSGAPLRHARSYHRPEPFVLESGATLPELTVCYETYGRLAQDRGNAVLICHAVSGDSHVASHDDSDEPGWWDAAVGPGRPIDTDRYFVICANVLGGCRGSTGPNFVNPVTSRRYGADFPTISVGDMVAAQALLLDHLGVERLLCVIGGSLGGFQALTWATRYPERTSGCIALATSPRLSSQALAFDVVGRNAILRDPDFRDGRYYDSAPPATGLAIARMLAHVTYLSRESMEEKFSPSRHQPRDVPTAFEKKFSVGSYLAHQGAKFVERFDANSYVTLSMAMDLFDLGDSHEKLRAAFATRTCRFLLISFSSDWLYSPEHSRAMTAALVAENKSVSYCDVASSCGHDAFLLEDDLSQYGRLMAGFLHGLYGGEGPAPTTGPVTATAVDAKVLPPSAATSIFAGQRLDHRLVLDLVPRSASVLDIGCGNGELLDLLRTRGHDRRMGIELDEDAVIACVARGHDVVQSDLERGLSAFPDRYVDVAILSQTLQVIEDISVALDELVRVARAAIVSFPNFAYRPLREMFYREGRIPKAEGLYRYEWYDSPNRRFPSILDFEELCAAKSIRLARRLYIDTSTGKEVRTNANLDADVAIVVIER